jgi:hypothetical protein
MDLMKHSEEIAFELPKSNRTRYAVRQPWDIWTKRMGNIQRRLRTEPCKNARSAAHSWACFQAKHCWRFQTGSTEMKEKKTIDVAELYFKVKDFLEDFDPNNRADLHR